jgi:hypothetical protein
MSPQADAAERLLLVVSTHFPGRQAMPLGLKMP